MISGWEWGGLCVVVELTEGVDGGDGVHIGCHEQQSGIGTGIGEGARDQRDLDQQQQRP